VAKAIPWNKTGLVVGRLSKEDLRKLILAVDDKELKNTLLGWLEFALKIEDELGLEVSVPLPKGVR